MQGVLDLLTQIKNALSGGGVTISASDIEIGAVEIKDGATDTRAKVKSDGTDNALVVMQNAPPTGSATSANQTVLNTKIDTLLTQTDGVEGSLTNIDTNAGESSDAAASAGGTGTLSAKLRKISADLATLLTQTDGIESSLSSISSSVAAATPAGEAHIGEVGGKLKTITVTPTLTTHASYAANDYVGTDATAMIFSGAVRINNGTGIILSAELIDKAGNTVPAELWLYDSAITPPNDSAAWTVTDADALKAIGVIPFSTYFASGANSISQAHNLGIAFEAIGGDTKIYGCLVTRGAPTYADGDLTVRLTILQN